MSRIYEVSINGGEGRVCVEIAKDPEGDFTVVGYHWTEGRYSLPFNLATIDEEALSKAENDDWG